MPGERVSCTGCHEDNRTSVQTKQTIADKKYFNGEIQKIKPVDADGVRPFGFEAEVWPIVKKYCTSCHGDPNKAPIARHDQGGSDEKNPNNLTGRRIVINCPMSAYRMIHPYCRRPGPETDATVLTPLDWHVSTSPFIQMLEKGHHGVKITPEEMKVIYTWIDLNLPFYGKWDPKAFKTDNYMLAADDQIKRRIDLMKEYANIDDDPEGEYDRYLAKVTNRTVNVVMPKPCKKAEAPTKQALSSIGWPHTTKTAYEICAGAGSDLSPVMMKVVDIGNGQSITFRRMPKGIYPMGSVTGYPNEAPVKFVTIDKPFWISETEIRNDQYNVFDPEHDSLYQKAFGKDHSYPGWIGNHRLMPVVRVSWNEANEFCKWLSKKAGVKATLPTEEQWEWAARAGTITPFPWGGLDDDFSKNANFADKDVRWARTGFQGGGAVQSRFPFAIHQNFPLHDERWTDDWFTINYVRRARPNLWGVYDMHGNAAEWTSSDYDEKRKTIRGGSFASRPRDGTSSWRWGYLPWQKVYDVGFRVIIEIDE
jgi:formylglycine-generating enzyme required for sulfatase activity